MIVLTARIESSVQERRELVQALVVWVMAARREAGTLAAYIYEDVEAPAAFCLVARWDSERSMGAHLGGPEFGFVLGALELLARPPEDLNHRPR